MIPPTLRLPPLHDLPRALVLDLDGTLLDPSGVLRPRSREAVLRLLDREVPVVVATARPLRSVRARIGIDVCEQVSVVHMNGAGLAPRGDAAHAAVRLAAGAAERVVALASSLAPTARVVCEIDGEEFGCDTPLDAAALWATNGATPDMVIPVSDALTRGATKIAVNGFGQPLSALASKIEEHLGATVTVIGEASGSFLNIVPPGTSKEAALRRLFGSASPWPGMLAFGDDMSDLETLRLAEYGVAMGNGHPAVLQAAPYRTYSNDEDGVAYVLERLAALSR